MQADSVLKGRMEIGTRLGYYSIALNVAIFVVKLILGLTSGSISIISDAFHTLSDCITSILVVISFRISAKPSDPEHPFGHGRAEQISAIVIATLLGVTAFELGKSSFARLLQPVDFEASYLIAAILLVTVLAKEGLARYTEKYSKELDSDALTADAWHHRSDAISTLLVVASVIAAKFGFVYLDPIAGLLIALYILYTAYIIVKKPVDSIMGTPTPGEITYKIKKIGAEIDHIDAVHDIIYHDYGAVQVVSLHIEVDENLTLHQAHHIAEEITRAIQRELGIFATVHVDPMSPKTELHLKIEKIINRFCKSHDLCHSFHELRLEDEEAEIRILFDLQINKEVSGKTKKALKREITDLLIKEVPQIKNVKIDIDPLFLLET